MATKKAKANNMTVDKTIAVLNAVREEASPQFQSKVAPFTTATNLARVGSVILHFPALQNEFLDVLINQYVYARTVRRGLTSAFDRFRTYRGNRPFGTWETFTNPVMPVQYDPCAFDRILKCWKPDVKTQYFGITREDLFPLTITEEVLEQAFFNYDNMSDFINDMLDAVDRGNTFVEFNEVKKMLSSNQAVGAIKTVEIPEINSANARSIVAIIREYVTNMTCPSSDYNNYINIEGATGDPVITSTPLEALCLIIDSKALSTLEVEALALAFQLEMSDFKINLIAIDNFGYDIIDREKRRVVGHQDSAVRFMIVDEAFIQLEDNIKLKYDDRNIMTLGRQHAFHVWQSINPRIFMNAVAFVEQGSTELEKSVVVLDTAGSDVVAFNPPIDEAPTIEYVGATFGADGYGYNNITAEQVAQALTVTATDTHTINVVRSDTDLTTLNIENMEAGQTLIATYNITTKGTAHKLRVVTNVGFTA